MSQLDHYRLLGNSGLRVSPLCLGTMTFGNDWGWGADPETSRRIFERYAEAGGNFIDTANFYTGGTSERILADLLGADRDRFVLATKYSLSMRRGDPNSGGNHRKAMRQSLEASLERLGTDHVDLYWIHVWDSTTPIEEVMRALDDLVRSGKVLHVAISDTPAWKVAQANTLADLRGWSPFCALQVEYNLCAREPERDLIPMARDLGLAVLPWSPLAQGVLTGKFTREDLAKQKEVGAKEWAGEDRRAVRLSERALTIADTAAEIARARGCSTPQVALAWLLTRPGVTSPILGVRTVEQLDDNLGALDLELTPEELERLDSASAIRLGFPHDFLAGDYVRDLVRGGTHIEG